MRIRFILAIALILLPEAASAQRTQIPRTRRGPARPAPLPPQPPSVAREMAYKRLPYSVETYPFISQFRSSAAPVPGAATAWTSGGIGQRLDFRILPQLSFTFDLTSSLFGGPTRTETMELGTRLRPQRNDRRLYPFLDLRFGYARAFESYFATFDIIDPYSGVGPGSRRSHGFGALGGAGIEVALSRMVSLTTSASLMRTRMSTHDFRGTAPTNPAYTMTTRRYTVGLRFNPVRMMPAPGPTLPAQAAPSP